MLGALLLAGCHHGLDLGQTPAALPAASMPGASAPAAGQPSPPPARPKLGAEEPSAVGPAEPEVKPRPTERVYHHPTDGFALTLPPGWESDDRQPGASLTAHPGRNEGLNSAAGVTVVTADTGRPMTVDELVDTTKRALDQHTEQLTPLEDKRLQVSGHDAARLVLAYRMENVGRLSMVFLVPGEKRSYMITCTAPKDRFDALRPTFEALGASFKID